MDKMFIANRITELRLKKNVSEYQMSLDLGRNKSYIQSLSSGRNNPTMENFLEICEYFEITPAQFFDPDITNPPLHTKASDLIKQLDDDDLLSLIPLFYRLTSKLFITVFELPFGSFFHFSQRNFSILSNFYFFSLITY